MRRQPTMWQQVVLAYLVSSVAFGQEIPGLNTGTPPKMMVIFDTSRSMRLLPNASDFFSTLPDGSISYKDDDYDPTITDGGNQCKNRFCIGKRVAYSTLPEYADSMELGMASYFQYRTRYQETSDQTACKYDIFASDGGVFGAFSSASSSLGGTSQTPMSMSSCTGAGSAALHSYKINYVSTGMTATSQAATVYNNVNDFASTTLDRSKFASVPDFTVDQTGSAYNLTSSGVSDMWFGGSSAMNSNLFVKLSSSTTCPVTNETTRYKHSGFDYSNSSAGAAAIDSIDGTPLYSSALTPINVAASPYLTFTRCGNNPFRCGLKFVGNNINLADSGVTLFEIAYADAGTPRTAAGLRYDYVMQSTSQTASLDDGTGAGPCKWPTTATTATTTRFYPATLPPAYGFTANCSNVNNAGCRVAFVNRTPSTTTDAGCTTTNPPSSWTPGSALVPVKYTTAMPTSVSAVCAGGVPASGSYNYTLTSTTDVQFDARAPSVGTCTALSDGSANGSCTCSSSTLNSIDAAGKLGTYSPSSWSSSCSVAGGCDFVGQGTSATGSSYAGGMTYYSPQSAAITAKAVFLTKGSETGLKYNLASAGTMASCPTSDQTAPLLPDVTGCAAGNVCKLTLTGFNATAGNSSSSTVTYAPPSFVSPSDLGAVYTNPTSAPVNGAYTRTVIADTGFIYTGATKGVASSCSGTTTGVTSHPSYGACTAARPCTVTIQPRCHDIDASAGVYTACNFAFDANQTYECGAKIKQWRYDAPASVTTTTYFGQCVYSRSTYKYNYPNCKFKVKTWTPSIGTCQSTLYSCTTNTVNATCNYRLDSFQYSFPERFNYCRVAGVSQDYSGTSIGNYNYNYNTKGGEYLGSFSVTKSDQAGLGSDNFCDNSPAIYPPIQSYCPEVLDSTNTGTGTFGSNAKSYCKNGRVCKLRWRTSSGALTTGRTSYTAGAVDETADVNWPRCLAPDRVGGEVASPTGVALMAASPTANFCVGINDGTAEQIRLRSDWYDPADSNPLASAPFANTSTNQANKLSGWSRMAAGPAADNFVAMGPGSTTISSIQQALTKCVKPTDLVTATGGGYCWAAGKECGPGSNSSCATVNDAGMDDFTPLFGSLKNAQDYMAIQLAADSEFACRKYFVLLITDGLESTPRNYGQSDLQSQVTGMRNTVAGGKTKDIQTFVIGFGAGLSDGGVSDLDVIARSGGTATIFDPLDNKYKFDPAGFALSANNEVDLRNRLIDVLRTATAGTFARSRPTLSTDGNRIYMAYFERLAGIGTDGGSSPEWKGHLKAFAVDSAGLLQAKWDTADKMNDPVIGTRNLQAMTNSGTVALRPFVSTDPLVTGAVATDGVNSVVFARNDSLGALPGEKFFGRPTTKRDSRFGAPVFSGPVLVGAPPFSGNYAGRPGETAFTSYAAFRGDGGVANRPQQVLIGTRDGMFRGISEKRNSVDCNSNESLMTCENGKESWGIVPYEPLTKLHLLREFGNAPLIDGTPAVSDVCLTSGDAKNCTASEWRTIALLPLRGGGSEVYAFDITDGGTPTALWKHSNAAVTGLTYSVPSIGRVETSSGAKWVAFMGGGYNRNLAAGNPEGVSVDGKSFSVIDVTTGTATNFMVPLIDRPEESIISRPALYKRAGEPNVESVYYGSKNGIIWAQRTLQTPLTSTPAIDWQPGKWFDPYGVLPIPDVYGNVKTPVYYIDKANGARINTGCSLGLDQGSVPVSPTTSDGGVILTNCNQLMPRQPIFSRPRALSLYDAARIQPDIYFGTGNGLNLNAAGRNMFFGVHDASFGTNLIGSGVPLWSVVFDEKEKILGEPTFVSGAVIVATYVPPSGNGCENFGDSYLYAFDPRTGAPKQVLQDPSGGPNPPFAAVVKKGNAGAISDLIAINGQIYFGNSKGDVSKILAKATGGGGKVMGWRRIK